MKKYIQNIILVFIVFTPVFNISELLQFLQGGVVSVLNFSGLSFLKYLKDIFFFLILFLCIIEVWRTGKFNYYNDVFILFLMLCLGSMVVSLLFVPVLGVLAGLRMIFSLLLLPFLYRIADKDFTGRVAKTLLAIFIFHFALQLIQVFVIGNLMFGANALGLSKRNPGIYIIPSSAGFFTLVCKYFFDYHLSIKSSIRRNILNIMILCSVFLAGSGTTVVAYFVYILVNILNKFDRKSKSIIFLPMIGLVVVFFSMLPILTSRDDIFLSLLTRLGIAGDVLQPQNVLLSPNFGLGTNIAKILKVPGALVLDSTYTAIIYNIGILGFISYCIFIYRLFSEHFLHTDFATKKQFLGFSCIFLMFSFTVIIFEAFPMNLLFAISLSYFKLNKISEQQEQHLSPV